MRRLAQNVNVRDLLNWDDCVNARSAIEAEPSNYIGGLKAYCSGERIELKPAAAKKLKAIEARMAIFVEIDD